MWRERESGGGRGGRDREVGGTWTAVSFHLVFLRFWIWWGGWVGGVDLIDHLEIRKQQHRADDNVRWTHVEIRERGREIEREMR